VDDKVAGWIRDELLARRPVSRAQIQEKALEIYAHSDGVGGKEFKVSFWVTICCYFHILRQVPAGWRNSCSVTISNPTEIEVFKATMFRLPPLRNPNPLRRVWPHL
jgi:hypothetical protein